MLRKILRESVLGLACAVFFPSGASAYAGDFGLKLEPGITIPLTDPQAKIYDLGGSLSLKALFGLTPYLDIGPTVSFAALDAAARAARQE